MIHMFNHRSNNTACRTIEYNGKTYEEIPEDMIREAAYAALKKTS